MWNEILGAPPAAMAPGGKSDSVSAFAPATLTGDAVTAAMGAILWREHRWLGLFGALPIGGGIVQLAEGRAAPGIGNIVHGTSALAGGLLWKKHPVGGWWIGFAVGLVADVLISRATHR